MTDALRLPAIEERTLPVRIAALVRNLPRRLREREFWTVQAGVLGVSAAHIAAELWASRSGLDVPTAFHHIPVILYLGPISYASLRYGTEGAVLTGLWSAALTTPNLLIWHRSDFEWLEIVYVAVVIVTGVIMSVPVERERLQRRHAEATSQRLALLDGIATLTLTADLRTTLDVTLRRLVDLLQLQSACVLAADPAESGTGLSVLANHPERDRLGTTLLGAPLERRPPDGAVATADFDPAIVLAPLAADPAGSGPKGHVEGLLAAKVDPGRPLTEGDHRLLAGVASHLAIAIANEQLAQSERTRLRSYAWLTIQAQEEERKRIARELHDEAAQNIVVIRRSLEDLASDLLDHPAGKELSALGELAGQTVAGIRRFSRDLRPPTLDELGLASALEQLVGQLRERSEMAAAFRVAGRPRRLPIETELAVFRVGQAALHNVERHAEAASVVVELTFRPGGVVLEIADDGTGFESPPSLDDLPTTGRLGLIGMHERSQLVGGSLQIVSRPGAGTRVLLEVPG